jgi:hypothetical protein
MSRPIAYNASGPLSGSIRGGSVNYTVDSGNRDYTTFASKKWVPSADGVAPIVFVTDSYTQGFELNPSLAVPLFYSCAGTGSAAIIYTANRVPGSPGNYSDANVALNDLITARGYFILESNDPYQGDYQSGNLLDLDASKMSSYPQTGTSWRDLSGQGNTGALTNGPTFIISSGSFLFDGVDDYVSAGNLGTIGNTQTIEVWFNSNSVTSYKNVLDMNYSTYSPNTGNVGPRLEQFSSGEMQWVWSGNTTNNYIYNNSITTPLLANRWYHTIFTLNSGTYNWYVNSTLINTGGSAQGYITTYSDVNLGRGFVLDPARYFSGLINSSRIYNKALSQTDIKQNYFGSPIFTDGLVFAVDANNIVSYPKSGTAWYNLTGSITSGTLVNGPTFNPNNGGSISFDGTDDYIFVSSNSDLAPGTGDFTYSSWINPNSYGFYAGFLIVENTNGLWIGKNGSNMVLRGYGVADYLQYGTLPTLNQWTNIIITRSGTLVTLYYNGLAVATSTTNANFTQGNTYIGNDGAVSSANLNGKIANTLFYKGKSLSAAEVLQNYQAEQYRFETPAGPVTNGLLLYWDAGNLDSYPGTGTTIYDLSGNGNNGSLVNGVGYNQTNGGVLTFDGVDDYVISYNPNLSNTTSTVMGAARYSGATRGRMINSTDVNWLMGHWSNSTENYYAEGWVTPVGIGNSDTNWRIYAALGDQPTDNYSLYVNNSVTATSNAGSSGPDGISIGAQTFGGTSEFSTGQFSFVLVYNRVLTAAEMTQNYNYFKGRFGL